MALKMLDHALGRGEGRAARAQSEAFFTIIVEVEGENVVSGKEGEGRDADRLAVPVDPPHLDDAFC